MESLDGLALVEGGELSDADVSDGSIVRFDCADDSTGGVVDGHIGADLPAVDGIAHGGVEAVAGSGSVLTGVDGDSLVGSSDLVPVGDLTAVDLGDLLHGEVLDAVDVDDDGDSVLSDLVGDESLVDLGLLQVPGAHSDVVGTVSGSLGSGSGSVGCQVEGDVGVESRVSLAQLVHGLGDGCGASDLEGLGSGGLGGVLDTLVLGECDELLAEDLLSSVAHDPLDEGGGVAGGLTESAEDEVPLDAVCTVQNIVLGCDDTVEVDGVHIGGVVSFLVVVTQGVDPYRSDDDDDDCNDCEYLLVQGCDTSVSE